MFHNRQRFHPIREFIILVPLCPGNDDLLLIFWFITFFVKTWI